MWPVTLYPNNLSHLFDEKGMAFGHWVDGDFGCAPHFSICLHDTNWCTFLTSERERESTTAHLNSNSGKNVNPHGH